MQRVSLVALSLLLASGAHADRSLLERRLDELRQEATAAFERISADRASSAGKNDERAQAELWDRRSFWTHFMDLVLELRKATATNDLTKSLPTRLAAAQRTLKVTGVRVEVTADGHVTLKPEPSSYADRESALKSGAAVEAYTRLQGGANPR